MPKRKSSLGRRSRTVLQSKKSRANAVQQAMENTVSINPVTADERRQARRIMNAQATAATRDAENAETRAIRLAGIAERRASSQGISKVSMSRWSFKAFNYDPTENYFSSADIQIGGMSKTCQHCCAKKWVGESAGICCSNGKVILPTLIEPPQPLKLLLTGTHSESRNFLKHIRQYNNAFQMTSFGSGPSKTVGYMPTFKVHGQVYHLIGSLQPQPDEGSNCLQIYFIVNAHQQALRRHSFNRDTNIELLTELQDMLHKYNSYVESFKYALEAAPSPNYDIIINADERPSGEHAGRYNAPSCNEVAVVLSGNQCSTRDIVIKQRDNTLHRISETHRSYDALQYPLLFVYGEDGYHFGIAQTNATNQQEHSTKSVSCMDFYAFRFMIRDNSFNHLHRAQDLFNQFAVDMFAKMESERLCFIKRNQEKLRCDSYIHLRDGMNNDADPNSLGQVCILPSTFIGSPRFFFDKIQDGLLFVRIFGRPELFITFTSNPKWVEIQKELFPGQTAMARHDITARVFRLKLIKLMDLITIGNIFGPVKCYMFTVEWQKRGLPHAHILIWLSRKIKSDDLDKIISAEFPDPSVDMDLYKKVKTHMVHGPCGEGYCKNLPCVENNKCRKRFPRKFLNETQTGNDGYPLYRRRSPEDGGFTATVRGHEIDNRYVVPYNALLLKIFDAHINVEFCNSVKSIKYICKYINKGSDAATFGIINAKNEVAQYQAGRYISTSEAFWRFFRFPIHQRYPAVQKLEVHLENGQRVYFTNDSAVSLAHQPRETTLTAFFKLCQGDVFAKTLIYPQVPSYFTWSNKKWSRRKKGQCVDSYPGIKFSSCLGRVYTVPPNQSECFYLRMLLHEVTGPTSFEDLRTVEGEVFSTYREACLKRGLLEDGSQWDATLEEVVLTHSSRTIRKLFALLLHSCDLTDPISLWLKYKDELSNDYKHQAQLLLPHIEISFNTEIYNKALIDIEDYLIWMGGKTLCTYGLPKTQRTNSNKLPTDIIQETSYDIHALGDYITENEPKLLADQLLAYNTIIESVRQRKGGIFFLDAPGGTGKTFVTKLILARVRQYREIAIAVASSGIAATLLPSGRTAHSVFKLPLDLTRLENPSCNITKESDRAQLLRRCQLIVWDECTMAHKGALEALDRCLRDIRDCSDVMGGITILLSGDFRQTLPVIPKGTRADAVKACLKSSELWQHVTPLRLTTNMRARLFGDPLSAVFATDILAIGNGSSPMDADGKISIDHICNTVNTVEDLKKSVFPQLQENYTNLSWLCERVILAPRNITVNGINDQLIRLIPGCPRIYKSVDAICDPQDAVHYPTEFLNSLDPSGLPPHTLVLKEGVPVILLRNITPPKLCNGTRLVVKRMRALSIDATIMSGCGTGEEVIIPRTNLTSSGVDIPFSFRRTQLPLRVAFAMSINKSQGQTLSVAGIHLDESCFSHGQFYVACSRVSTKDNLFAFVPNGKTKNVVYNEVL